MRRPGAPLNEYWSSVNGSPWRFVVEPLTAVELAAASTLMAARFGPNAKPQWTRHTRAKVGR